MAVFQNDRFSELHLRNEAIVHLSCEPPSGHCYQLTETKQSHQLNLLSVRSYKRFRTVKKNHLCLPMLFL